MTAKFGEEHGDVLARWVSTREGVTRVISEIVTVNYHDGSRPSTAIMEEASFSLVGEQSSLKLEQRIMGSMPVTVLEGESGSPLRVELTPEQDGILVTVGSEVSPALVKSAYKPVASDARLA